MSAPIPSFFKLRFGLVALCFLLFFMLLGFLRDVFASQSVTCGCYTGTVADNVSVEDCKIYPNADCRDQAVANDLAADVWEYYCTAPGTLARTCYNYYTGTVYPTGLYVYCDDCIDLDNDCQCDPPCAQEQAAAEQECGGPDTYNMDMETCQYTCDPCADQIVDAAFECGQGNYTIDEQCFWECKCPDTCTQQCSDLQDQCTNGEYSIVDEETCTGKCKDCTDEAAEACGGAENVEWTEDGDCSYNCKRPCEDEQDQLAWECGGTDQYTIDTATCAGCCITEDNHDCDDIPDDQDDDDDNDGMPDGDDPCPLNPDPNCQAPDSDGDGTPDDQDDDDDNDGVPDKDDPCPNNPDPDCQAPDSDGDGIPDKDDPCPDNPNPDCAPGDSDGDGSPDPDSYLVKEPPYTVSENDLSNQFTTRWNEFVGELKQTSLFSIPDQVFGGFSSGSESASITIEGGETFGQHEVDFSDWSSGLAALRAVLYAIFGTIAVRIVTLKR